MTPTGVSVTLAIDALSQRTVCLAFQRVGGIHEPSTSPGGVLAFDHGAKVANLGLGRGESLAKSCEIVP
jgi:hypothetical protein